MPGTPPTRFVYLGPEGTFAEQALRTVPAAERGDRTPARSGGEALDAVRAGEADAALVPLENSIGGAGGVTRDELGEGDPLVITREVVLPVEFVLAARAGTTLSDVRSVAAHPQASTQCRGWLREHLPDATVVDVLSNGAAAAGAASGEYDAAICAPIGATRHRLAVLADKIADHPGTPPGQPDRAGARHVPEVADHGADPVGGAHVHLALAVEHPGDRRLAHPRAGGDVGDGDRHVTLPDRRDERGVSEPVAEAVPWQSTQVASVPSITDE